VKISFHKLGRIRGIPLSLPKITSLAKAILKKEKNKVSGDLTFVFCDKLNIRRMNRLCFNKSTDTDVIAIPFHETPLTRRKTPDGADKIFADVYICLPKARENAAAYDESYKREVTRLIVHGLLHLSGYEDGSPAEKHRMWKRQEAYLK